MAVYPASAWEGENGGACGTGRAVDTSPQNGCCGAPRGALG